MQSLEKNHLERIGDSSARTSLGLGIVLIPTRQTGVPPDSPSPGEHTQRGLASVMVNTQL